MLTLTALLIGLVAAIIYYLATPVKRTAAIIAACAFGLAGLSFFFVPGTSPIILINFFTAAVWAMMASTAENG